MPAPSADHRVLNRSFKLPLLQAPLVPAWLLPTSSQQGFRIGGINATAIIRALASLEGCPIPTLEARMRPGNKARNGSLAGFLGSEESLLAVMAADNEHVLKAGTTHHAIAVVMSNAADEIVGGDREGTVTINGVIFRRTVDSSNGVQQSPFVDAKTFPRDVYPGNNITIVNSQNGASITFAAILPALIDRYGFYEGHGTSYRVAPADILRVFPFLLRS